MTFTVRPYRSEDRDPVRRICWETGYMGEPAGWYWRDQPSFADLFSGYYTDAEPESAFVAERVDGEGGVGEGGVGGYLLGCVDSRRVWPPERVIGRALVRRWLLARPGTARFLWRSFGDLAVDAWHHRLPPRPVVDDRWPAHLHIDLLPAARGQGVGAALMRTWLDRLRGADVPGCHLETMAENTAGIAFFTAMGFVTEGPPQLVPGMRTRAGARMHVQMMVQDLRP